ncbi:MAG: PAS domain-containing protein [Alphaproteobacteria bacterium]|nr:PAS domain-containing protein [Alphaproteobacteria bacterium]
MAVQGHRAPSLALALAGSLTGTWPAHAAAGEVAPTGVLVLAAVAILAAALLAWQWRSRLAADQAARASAAREAQLAAVVAAAPTALLAIERETGMVRASDRLASLLGRAPGSGVAAADVLDLFDQSGAARLRQAIDRLRADGQPFRFALDGAAPSRRYLVEGAHAAGVDVLAIGDTSTEAQSEAAQRAAEAARDRFDQVIRSVPIALWARRADQTIDVVNPAAGELLDSHSEGVALAERAQRLGRAQSESRAVVIAGQRRLVEFTEIPASGGDTVGFASDVTQLEQTQAELARHVAAHAEVLESLDTAIAILGPDQRLKFFNAACARLWHLEPRWLAAEPTLSEILDLLRERRQLPEVADFRAYRRERLRQLASVIEPQVELEHLPDGTTLRRTTVAHPFGGVLFTYEDVTDRLALEASYNTLIEVQCETLDNLQEAVAVFGGDGRLKLSNPAFATLWRIDGAELVRERHISELIELMRPLLLPVGDWVDFKARMIADVFERTPKSGRVVRQDGAVLDFANVPLPDGATQIIYVDVSDRVRVEQALRERNMALEAADHLKSEFVANVSYELRTPLNAIIGFSEILANGYFGTLNPRQLEYARAILESSNRLVALINNILDLATIEAGYMRLERSNVDVAALVEGVAALTRERARTIGVQLNVVCGPALGRVSLDERRIKQALFNLVANAIKYTTAGGSVTIAAKHVNGELELAVSDTGVGIPLEEQAQVFEKFQRGSQPGSATGLGLGLSLVKSYIELHDGRVALTSAPGVGTTVTCHLPAPAIAAPSEGEAAKGHAAS